MEFFKSINFPEIKQKFFDNPIYCKPLRNMTPEKPSHPLNDKKEEASEDMVGKIPRLWQLRI